MDSCIFKHESCDQTGNSKFEKAHNMQASQQVVMVTRKGSEHRTTGSDVPQISLVHEYNYTT